MLQDKYEEWLALFQDSWPLIFDRGLVFSGAVLVALAAFIVLRLLRGRLVKILHRQADAPTLRDVLARVLRRTSSMFIAIVSLAIACVIVGFWNRWTQSAITIVLLVQGGIWLATAVKGFLDIYASRRAQDQSAFRNALSIVRMLANVAIWSIVLMAILSNLGVDITAMIAGLGIGGIAIGLAAQGIFADLFGSLSIVFDRPFMRGDFITFGEYSGTIESIGMKSTRIRALSGEQIVLSNANLLQSTIRNYQRLYERRVLFSLGLVYETPVEKVESVPGIVREIIEGTEGTRFDRCHFKSFGDFALVFEIVYFVLSQDYNRYMDVHHAINLNIMRRFQAEGLVFAYPNQTLYFARAASEPGTQEAGRQEARSSPLLG